MSCGTQLESILQPGGLSVVFQPIVEISSDSLRLHGVESLSRGPTGSATESAEVLFSLVREHGVESIVDQACIMNVFERAKNLPVTLEVSINVHANTIAADGGFVDFLRETADQWNVRTTRLTLEIVEYAPSQGGLCFSKVLERLRNLGIRIALDDVGAGDSNFKKIVDCRPDYLKIDRYLVEGAHRDAYRQAVLESLSDLANKVDARVVAEGVESPLDVEILSSVGIDLAQGYLFSPPLTVEELENVGWLSAASNKTWERSVLTNAARLDFGEGEEA